ncbi:MAG: hypothetical protein PHH84_00935 [Oscillospiraceae bacterium]|nr:hypothetical protein [Oscillospiraceae bacterium]MDD4413532.1 hypothetical protein [Oscillospiraceae bacterium]
MKKKILASVVSALVLVFVIFPFVPVMQSKAEEVVFTNFAPTKSMGYWKQNYTPNSTTVIESNALKGTFPKPVENYYADDGEWGLEFFRNDGTFIDISDATKIRLELYVSDPIVINNAWYGSIVFISGALGETEKMEWKVGFNGRRGFTTGWNTVTLNIADATVGADFDYNAIKVFKVFAGAFFGSYTATTGYTVQIRNIVALKDVAVPLLEGRIAPTYTLDKWNINHPGAFSLEGDDTISGDFAKPTGHWYPGGAWVFDWHDPAAHVDITGAVGIKLDVYVSDPVVINNCSESQGNVSMKSGGITSAETVVWNLGGTTGKKDFVQGWNTATFFFSNATSLGASFNLANINTFKITGVAFFDSYTAEIGYTVKVRNVAALMPEPATTTTTAAPTTTTSSAAATTTTTTTTAPTTTTTTAPTTTPINMDDYAVVPFISTDEIGFWDTEIQGGTFSIDNGAFKGDFVKPTGSWYGQQYGYGEWIMQYFRNDYTYMDLTNAEYIMLDIYVSDPVVINAGTQGFVELKSGTFTTEESCIWAIGASGKNDFVQGWNTITLPINDETKGAAFQQDRFAVFKVHVMNFIGSYTSDTGYTVQLKNINALIPKTMTTTTTTTTVTATTLEDISNYDTIPFIPTDTMDFWCENVDKGTFTLDSNSIKGEFLKPTGPWYDSNGEWVLEYFRNDGSSVNISGAEKIKFDIYISDPKTINYGTQGKILLASGNLTDNEKCYWNIGATGLKDFTPGWNTVILDLNDATLAGSLNLFEPANIKVFKVHEMNFIGSYTATGGYTIQLRNIVALVPQAQDTTTTPPPATTTAATTTSATTATEDNEATTSIEDETTTATTEETTVTISDDEDTTDGDSNSPKTGYSELRLLLVALLAGSVALFIILEKKRFFKKAK